MRWVEVTVNDVALYGTFLNYSLIDQINKPLQVSADSTGSILTFTLPHFWVNAIIDPGIKIKIHIIKNIIMNK